MKNVKLWLKLRLINLRDLVSGTVFKFAKRSTVHQTLNHRIQVVQEIKKTETLENKLHNIRAASEKINAYIILPGQIFSFWKIVGDPEKGMRKSRSIVNGQLVNESGGGICQVSGILYHASIIAGLAITERHNHSVDLYTEETRFAPLGSDATVAYGNKDLRIKNNFGFPVKFEIDVTDNTITVRLLSKEKLKERHLHFTIEETGDKKLVEVKDEYGNFVNHSVYRKLE